MSQMRDVCLPLEKLDKCNTCGKRSNLQLCSKCGESIYCSPKCQKKDWPHHKLTCNLDRVDLAVMYPFLASLAEIGHCRQWKPFHPALTHQIVFPENWPHVCVVPIILDDRIPEDEFTLAKWCPRLPTDSDRRKVFQRILHEGYTLPILVSISIALLAGIYTTKAVRAPNGNVRRGVRLMYRGSPISDFGIAKGSLNVQEQNRLVYFKETPIILFSRGQDPNEHYWLYFKTIKNEEAIVDLATSMFNVGSQVKVDPYIPGVFPKDSFAPALFQEDCVAGNVIGAHRERERFSVLRNDDLRAIAYHATGYRVTRFEADDMWDFMDTVAGRECEGIEKMIATDVLQSALAQFESIVEERAWRQWPKTPECRPCSDDAESGEWWEELMKWKKRNKSYVPQDQISSISRLDDMMSDMITVHISQDFEIFD
ncbi:hypothetical protein M378DRAFT_102907 [Amanita muscaria Koide BX008]|uniref:MYND-type domain-containing protein n=1 Tax=Amanita muscaria (strain Koide BX008) TaxID=946122 RepID=A0A0C2STM0_AMAMK|nr:hypothetical protein M378DRAFT_102907 [Amanita muscaria Koide BX008]